MTSPEPAADAAVQAQLAQQAADVTGVPSAGIYGDPAGAQAAPQPLDLSAAHATAADVEQLLAQLQELQSRAAAAVAAAEPVPEVPDDTVTADSGAPGWLHAAFAKIEKRLAALEGGTGTS